MSEPAPGPRPLWVLALLGGLALALFVGLGSLGVWQVQRLAWKQDLIARVTARVDAPPVAAPGPADWPDTSAARDEYRRVTLRGQFRHDLETPVQALTREGSGFWILTPLQTDEGWVALINRGFVPPELRDPASRPAPPATAEITGLLRLSEPGGGFLRENDPVANRWYSRDVGAIARARGLDMTAPWFIDAEGGQIPMGGLTVISFRNHHLGYALTWFALALGVAGAAFWVGRHEGRLRHGLPGA